MNRRTVVELARDAADELSFARDIDSLFSEYNEGDTSDKRLRRALTKTVEYLADTYDWQELHRERLFRWPGNAGCLSPGWKPCDFRRFVINTATDRSRGLPLIGPVTPAEWQEYRLRQATAGNGMFRIASDAMFIAPKRPRGALIAFEYITDYLFIDEDGKPKPRATADTDKTRWDDELIIQGIVFNYRKMERLDYASDQFDFEKTMADRIKMDGSRRIIDMTEDEVFGDLAALKWHVTVNNVHETPTESWSVGDDYAPAESWSVNP